MDDSKPDGSFGIKTGRDTSARDASFFAPPARQGTVALTAGECGSAENLQLPHSSHFDQRSSFGPIVLALLMLSSNWLANRLLVLLLRYLGIILAFSLFVGARLCPRVGLRGTHLLASHRRAPCSPFFSAHRWSALCRADWVEAVWLLAAAPSASLPALTFKSTSHTCKGRGRKDKREGRGGQMKCAWGRGERCGSGRLLGSSEVSLP